MKGVVNLFLIRREIKMIKGVITHPRPHIDEIAAMFLLSLYGEEKYPGVRQAIADGKVYTYRVEQLEHSPEEYEEEGYLLLGVGGGRFDEHPDHTTGAVRKEDECCVSLVAKDLGIQKLPELSRILKYVVSNDLKGNAQPDGLANMVKLFYAQYPDDQMQAIRFAFAGLGAWYHEQYDFHVNARREVAEKIHVEVIDTAAGDALKVALIVTDNRTVCKYIRSEYFGGADVIVQQDSAGRTQIFTDKRKKIDLADTARILRVTEQRIRRKLVTTDWTILAEEGTVEGAEEWHYFLPGKMILNGSDTSPDTPPTKIPRANLFQIVKVGVSEKFESAREKDCLRGVCTSSRKNPCPLYYFGLTRCQRVRASARKAVAS